MSKQLINSDFVLSILVSQDSARQNYVFDLIFKQLLGIKYQLVDTSYKGKVLSYGKKTSEFYIKSHPVLFETNIRHQELEYTTYNSYEFPFSISDETSAFPFDLFAVCFYCVTRYEEYIDLEVDNHGRFKPENSWLFQKGLVQVPVVNFLVSELKSRIEQFFGVTLLSPKEYSINPTIDIDNAYAFHNRMDGLFASKLKSLLKLNLSSLKIKREAQRDKEKDPFNTHHQLIGLFGKYRPTVFFLMKCKGQDSTNNTTSTIQAELIKEYEQNGFEIGIHPSYDAIKNETVFQELASLKKVTIPVSSCRYHFIKNKLPDAYHGLITHGITKECSMGYATTSGFRAGICHPYQWFDLEKNEESELMIHPFYFMDATFIFNTNKDSKEALQEVKTITTEVKKYKGQHCFVFHNESLSNKGVYRGWGDFAKNVMEVVV